MSAPDLSVVVIGRNEGARLTRCLESVRAMRLPGRTVEVVYVDSASSDDSPARAGSLGARVVALRTDRPTAARGRNAGWRAALAPLVLFLDGDTVLQPEFVARALPLLDDPRVAIVWGHRRELRPEASVYNRLLDLDWLFPVGEAEFCGGDALVRRAVLEQVDGYDDSLIAGEEPEMCRRILARGHRIVHADLPMTGHDLDMRRFSQYWRRALRAGRAYAEVSERFRSSAAPFWEGVAAWNRRSARFFLALLALLGLGLLLAPLWPVALALPAAALAAIAALCLRSAWKMRWKTSHLPTLLLYGAHSHFQQIPIYFGQLAYQRDRRAGVRAGIVEYKETPR